MSSNRNKLNKNLKASEFKEYYFLKEELKEFCRNEGLKLSGSKSQLEERIICYLDTGKSSDDSNPTKNNTNFQKSNLNKAIASEEITLDSISNPTKNNANFQKSNLNKAIASEEITLDSILGENFKCSEDKREFFEKEIRKGFKFKVLIMSFKTQKKKLK